MPEQPAQNEVHKGSTIFRINCLLEGFPVEIEATGRADNLKALVKKLKEIGATPVGAMPAKNGKGQQPASGETPRCPYHGPMKQSNKAPGTWFCSKRMGDGGYCKSKFPEGD